MANNRWCDFFPRVEVFNLANRAFNHNPLYIILEGYNWSAHHNHKPFQYETRWAKLEGFRDVVKKGWRVTIRDKDPWVAVKENMQTCRGMIKKWVRKNTKKHRDAYSVQDTPKKKKKKEEEIQSLPKTPNLEEEKALKSKLHSLLEQEDLKWRQRVKVEWLPNGDRNTKFFHACANQRMRINNIGNILDVNGISCTRPEDVERAFVGYFHIILITCKPTTIKECTSGI
jgi:hypothetical protein